MLETLGWYDKYRLQQSNQGAAEQKIRIDTGLKITHQWTTTEVCTLTCDHAPMPNLWFLCYNDTFYKKAVSQSEAVRVKVCESTESQQKL